MAPTLVASYFVQQNTTASTAIATPSFTPSNGEVIIVKLGTWDTGTSMGAPTGGSQTYTSRIINAPGGFNGWCGIYTAVISGSPGSMTISSTPAASARYSMTVERWSGAQLAATPVTASSHSTGAAAGSITPSAGTSVISWVSSDAGSVDPATRAYLGSGTDEGVRDGHAGSNGVEYYGYQLSTGTGSQSYGLSAPTGQTFVIAGIEVQAGSASTTADAALAVTATLSASATDNQAPAAALAVTASLAAAASRTAVASASLAVTATLSAGGPLTKPVDAALAVTASLSATAGGPVSAAAALAVTASLTAGASTVKPGASRTPTVVVDVARATAIADLTRPSVQVYL